VYHLPHPRCDTSGPTLPLPSDDAVSHKLKVPLLSPLEYSTAAARGSAFGGGRLTASGGG